MQVSWLVTTDVNFEPAYTCIEDRATPRHVPSTNVKRFFRKISCKKKILHLHLQGIVQTVSYSSDKKLRVSLVKRLLNNSLPQLIIVNVVLPYIYLFIVVVSMPSCPSNMVIPIFQTDT